MHQYSPGGSGYRPADDFSGFVWEVAATSPTWRELGANLTYRRGRAAIFQEGITGRAWMLTGGLDLRPASTIRVAATGTVFRLHRLDGSEFARSTIPRLKLEYQPNRALFFRIVGEYRSERQAELLEPASGAPLFVGGEPQPATRFKGLRVDVLGQFEPTPGTIAFLGYGSSLQSDEELNWSRLQRVSDGFFLKLAYQVRP